MNKACGVDGIPVELLNPKRWCFSAAPMKSKIWKLTNGHTWTEKASFQYNPKEGRKQDIAQATAIEYFICR